MPSLAPNLFRCRWCGRSGLFGVCMTCEAHRDGKHAQRFHPGCAQCHADIWDAIVRAPAVLLVRGLRAAEKHYRRLASGGAGFLDGGDRGRE